MCTIQFPLFLDTFAYPILLSGIVDLFAELDIKDFCARLVVNESHEVLQGATAGENVEEVQELTLKPSRGGECALDSKNGVSCKWEDSEEEEGGVEDKEED